VHEGEGEASYDVIIDDLYAEHEGVPVRCVPMDAAWCEALGDLLKPGGMLIFGGELNDFARRLMYVVLVAGILLGATQIVGLFGASGASIGLPDQVTPGGRGEGTDG